ncbi:MAG TPA: hypothetical protein PLU24_05885, partial [Candidatus Omnitrophota bacterium]|nr:hypothetical protein [Candidatus Omnitrophota bacterium]
MKIRCLFVALIIAVSFFAGCSKERKPDIVSLTPEEEEFQKKALEKTRYSIKNEPPAVYKNTLPPMAEVNASYPAALTMHLPGPKGQENTHEQFLYIYKDKGWKGNHFIPSGWMGDARDLVFSDDHTIDCYSGSCIKISYSNMASGG